jgi:hypothetical protein
MRVTALPDRDDHREPAVNTAMPARNTFRRPNRSPTEPQMSSSAPSASE